MTRKERDFAIVEHFNKCLDKGMTKTEATSETQEKFGFLTPVPVYNARRRVQKRKEEENGTATA